jgi:hypothetical protein
MNFKPSEFACRCGNCGGSTDKLDPDLLDALERVRAHYGHPMPVNSGVRCPAHNKAEGGAPKSAHMEGKAADVADPQGHLASILTDLVCEKLGIWIEDPRFTKGWVHVQVRPVASRRFRPY